MVGARAVRDHHPGRELAVTPTGPAARLEQGHGRHLSGMVAIPCGADLRIPGRDRAGPRVLLSSSCVPASARLGAGPAPGPAGSAPSGPSWSPTPSDMPTPAAGLRLHLRHSLAFGSSFVPRVEFRRQYDVWYSRRRQMRPARHRPGMRISGASSTRGRSSPDAPRVRRDRARAFLRVGPGRLPADRHQALALPDRPLDSLRSAIRASAVARSLRTVASVRIAAR